MQYKRKDNFQKRRCGC